MWRLLVMSCVAMQAHGPLINRIDVFINCTPIRVKINFKLTNLMKISRIERYNGKYGSNPHGIREISHDLFEFGKYGTMNQ